MVQPRVVDILFGCFDTLGLTLKELGRGKEEFDTSLLVQKWQALHRRSPLVAHESNNEPQETRYDSRDTQIEKIQNIEVKVERVDLLMNLV